MIMENNGRETGYLIKLVKINGKLTYIIHSESTTLLEEGDLVQTATEYTMNSNITLDFSEIKDFAKESDYVSYITQALANISGEFLTDAGKSDLVIFFQDAIANFATIVFPVTGDQGEISATEVVPLVEKAENLFADFMDILTDSGEELNKNPEQAVRVVVQNLSSENWTIYLNSDLLNQLKGKNLQVFLEDGRHGLEFSGEDLDLLLTAHEGIFVNVQNTGEEQYSITFGDKNGGNIEKLEAPVKIFLPTENEFSTVMLEYAQGTENWGGQFNSSTKTIQFSTIHPGTYLIVDNSVEINDVDEQYKNMIQFMVSKGFFTVDEEGNFNPTGTLTRNEFTKILVSMFFALDRNLSTNFPDVEPDSQYHDYIASGESRDIVAGYDDGLFYGDTIITEEMVFTLIAQTLADKKGHIYPEDLETYLNLVTGGQNGSEWSRPGLALSIRDSIVLPEESVRPQEDISRQNAAIYLYRLFMLLEEKHQVNFELSTEIQVDEEVTGGIPPTLALLGGGIVLSGAGAGLYYYDKKKKGTGSTQG